MIIKATFFTQEPHTPILARVGFTMADIIEEQEMSSGPEYKVMYELQDGSGSRTV